MLSIKENCKSVEEYNLLYDSIGWGAYNEEIARKALDNTYYSVSIYEDDNIVGYGRLIGDTICFMYIQDVMVKPEFQNKKIGTMIMILFYSIWTIFELFCNNLIDNGIGNEFIQQFIKSGIIKNIVWTIPAIFLINYYKSEVYITLKEMFCKKVEWIKYLSVFLIFTAWLIIGSILQNGKIECDIRINELIIVLFVGITEEMFFRGWLLNITIKEDRKWLFIFINAIMFLLIHLLYLY